MRKTRESGDLPIAFAIVFRRERKCINSVILIPLYFEFNLKLAVLDVAEYVFYNCLLEASKGVSFII